MLWYWSRKARPKIQDTTLIPGLREKVKVLWGPYAVPHLFADNEDDLFMAQGYLHAQERLWQMDFNRRFLTGRLAEILGESVIPWEEISVRFKDKTTVDLDHFVRLMGIRRAARASDPRSNDEGRERKRQRGFSECEGGSKKLTPAA